MQQHPEHKKQNNIPSPRDTWGNGERHMPFFGLSREELLKVAQRPVLEDERQRMFFTLEATDWELTRTFVDARDDLTDWEWAGVFQLYDTAKTMGRKYGPYVDMSRWVGTKNMSELALWLAGCYHDMSEAFDHIGTATLLAHFKRGDRIYNHDGWLIAVDRVGTSLLEVTHTEDLRTLGRVVGMSGKRFTKRDLDVLLRGEPVNGVRRDVCKQSSMPPADEAGDFAYGFHSVDRVNTGTLLAVLQLLGKHLDSGSRYDLYLFDWLTDRDEAKTSREIQRWLGR